MTDSLEKHDINVVVLALEKLGMMPEMEQSTTGDVMSVINSVLTLKEETLHGFDRKLKTSQR